MERLRNFAKAGFSRSKPTDVTFNWPKRKDGNANNRHSNCITDFEKNEFTFIWRINNMHLCTLKYDEFLESPTFSTNFCGGEVKWVMRIYPSDLKRYTKNYLLNATCQEDTFFYNANNCEKVVYLINISTGPINSSFRYRFYCRRSPVQKVKHIYIYPSRPESSLEDSTDELFYLNDCQLPEELVIKCDIHAIRKYNMRTPTNEAVDLLKSNTIFKDLKEMYKTGKFSDVTLQAGNKKFPAHKNILASRSKVFDAMFQHDMREAQTNVVQIEDVEPADLKSLLLYIYTGSLDNFDIEKAISLYPIADKYFLEELKSWCADMIIRNMKVKHVCYIALLADLYPDPKLKEAIIEMFRNYTSCIFKRKEWQDLVRNANHQALVSEILSAISKDFTMINDTDLDFVRTPPSVSSKNNCLSIF